MAKKMKSHHGRMRRMVYLRSVEEIPEFASAEEEAEFWETHSPVEILDRLEPVRVQLAPGLRRRLGERLLAMCLSARQIERVSELARKRRVSTLTLIRRWIEQGLQGAKG